MVQKPNRIQPPTATRRAGPRVTGESHDGPVEAAILAMPLDSNSRVLVAVSGGADSTALLDVLARLVTGGRRSWVLRAAHVNHGLRGHEADQDEEFVRALARDRGVPLDVVGVDVEEHSRARGASIEAMARELRYNALYERLDAWPGDVLVTAHTMDDQAETVLLNLLRGAGLTGVAAMPDRRDRLVRPFLSVRRHDILEYLQRQHVGYRLDSSNTDPRFARNRIRREVLPVLRRVRPDVVEKLARSAALAAQDDRLVREQVDETIGLLEVRIEKFGIAAAVAPWRSAAPPLRLRILRALLARLGAAHGVSTRHLGDLAAFLEKPATSTRTFHALPNAVICTLDPDRFHLSIAPVEAPPVAGELALPVPGSVFAGSMLFSSETPRLTADELHRRLAVCGPHHALCDARALGRRLVVRRPRPGERLRPLGLHGSKKIQDLLVDRRVPVAERARLLVVGTERQLIWIPGVALDERAAVGPQTDRVVHLTCRPTPTG
ncbi:MAG TPA: tRNA lysidine(34) synthetase TilS [Chloroflexota bacterium]|nr:tRNA lysidine(34) synthetase TilS [Chloroflexota bacterium]